MFVTELIQRTVAGRLRFDFIESTITATDGRVLSSQKGRAQSEPSGEWFLYQFHPRGALKDEWVQAGGFLDPAVQEAGEVTFRVFGAERSSTTWSGEARQLRHVRGTEGDVIHGRLREWSRADEHFVRTPFVRVVIAGACPYPAKIRNAPGRSMRSARLSVDGLQIEFRDHGDHTEICAQNPQGLPDDPADKLVAALGDMFDFPLDWVFRELHGNGRRTITVRPQFGPTTPPETPSALATDYHAFWRSFSDALAARL